LNVGGVSRTFRDALSNPHKRKREGKIRTHGGVCVWGDDCPWPAHSDMLLSYGGDVQPESATVAIKLRYFPRSYDPPSTEHCVGSAADQQRPGI